MIVGLLAIAAGWSGWLAWFLFLVAAASDWLDGYLARRLQQQSAFGICLDPIADKVLVLVVLSAAPHPLDPATTYAPTPVGLAAWRSGTAGADDVCRRHCAENDRGFINTERGFL